MDKNDYISAAVYSEGCVRLEVPITSKIDEMIEHMEAKGYEVRKRRLSDTHYYLECLKK